MQLTPELAGILASFRPTVLQVRQVRRKEAGSKGPRRSFWKCCRISKASNRGPVELQTLGNLANRHPLVVEVLDLLFARGTRSPWACRSGRHRCMLRQEERQPFQFLMESIEKAFEGFPKI